MDELVPFCRVRLRWVCDGIDDRPNHTVIPTLACFCMRDFCHHIDGISDGRRLAVLEWDWGSEVVLRWFVSPLLVGRLRDKQRRKERMREMRLASNLPVSSDLIS